MPCFLSHSWITFPHPRIEPRLLLPPDAYDDPDRGTTVAAFLTGIYGDLSECTRRAGSPQPLDIQPHPTPDPRL